MADDEVALLAGYRWATGPETELYETGKLRLALTESVRHSLALRARYIRSVAIKIGDKVAIPIHLG